MSLENMEQIRHFYKHKLSKSFPFDTHPLSNGTIQQKELYCTMLTLIMYEKHEPAEVQIAFLERIAMASQCELTKQALVERAESIDESFATYFCEAFVEHPLAQNFIIDALLLVYCTGLPPSTAQQSFLVEVMNALNIDTHQLATLIETVNELLSVSAENYIDILKRKKCM